MFPKIKAMDKKLLKQQLNEERQRNERDLGNRVFYYNVAKWVTLFIYWICKSLDLTIATAFLILILFFIPIYSLFSNIEKMDKMVDQSINPNDPEWYSHRLAYSTFKHDFIWLFAFMSIHMFSLTAIFSDNYEFEVPIN